METKRGCPTPIGVSETVNGTNFAVFSKHATEVKLCLYNPGEEKPFLVLELDPHRNKTGEIWHVLISDPLPIGLEYGYNMNGPQGPQYCYDPARLLIDPYAKGMNFPRAWGAPKPKEPRGKAITKSQFDWQGDYPPLIPEKELIIYEMHVRGLTEHPSSGVKNPGTYLAVIDKIPHFKKMGVNAVQLMPIFEFNENEYHDQHPNAPQKLVNYWGYSTINFFSPTRSYAATDEWDAEIIEFKTMVRELHKNGIEVILDVVYNHTAEGGKGGPVYSFRGIDNNIYYMVDQNGNYRDFTGCGNTVNTNHPVVAKMIIDSLRYWVTEMHVDGFRFDLASILCRKEDGSVSEDPFVVAAIAQDPVLSKVKLIAEAWDAGGLYQVGHFPYYHRWAELNGKYRDQVRDFIKGTSGSAENFVRSFTGSEYLYGKSHSPYHSVNFLTSHDGFSLYDLVSYMQKHNEANGENNKDGFNDNRSWNCGAEGETDNPEINQLRQQQIRNFHLALIFSLGTPLILMGDEYAHTRHGNNNTWCQDNDLNWFLWDKLEKEKDFFRFYCLVIQLRQKNGWAFPDGFHKKEDIDWHGANQPFHPDWGKDSRCIALTIKNKEKGNHLYLAFNSYFDKLTVHLPPPTGGKKWYRVIDTSLKSPDDFVEDPQRLEALKDTYEMRAHSSLVLQLL